MTPRPAAPVIPGWKMLGYIGAGGMATVWRARRADGTVAAIKVHRAVTTHGVAGTESLFRRESLACLNVVHPNLVRGLDAGTTADGSPYLALEFVAGETLDAALKRMPRLDETRVVAIGLGLARALDHAHRMGLVHRDVKPRNVMLMPDGGVKLLDLGLVVETAEGAGTHRFGTFGFTAPEVMRGDAPGPRSDLFMLGVTLAMAATGVAPSKERGFEDRTMKEIGGGELSPGLARVLERLVKSDPSARYGSAAELVLDLESLTAGERPLGAILGSSGASVVRKGPRVAGIMIFVAAAAVMVAWIVTREEKPADLPKLATDAEVVAAPRAPDPRLSAAKLYVEQFPSDFARGRELLAGADTAALSSEERAELEAAQRALDARFDAAATAALADLQDKSNAALAAGDVQRARDILAAWPEALHDAPQAAEAANRAAAVLAKARADAAALVDLAIQTLKAPPGGENARVAKVLEEALAGKPFDGDRRGELEEFRATLAARMAATTRHDLALKATQAAIEAWKSFVQTHLQRPSARTFHEVLMAARFKGMPEETQRDAESVESAWTRAEAAVTERMKSLSGKTWFGPCLAALAPVHFSAPPAPEDVLLAPVWARLGGRSETIVSVAGGSDEAAAWLFARGLTDPALDLSGATGALTRLMKSASVQHTLDWRGDWTTEPASLDPDWELSLALRAVGDTSPKRPTIHMSSTDPDMPSEATHPVLDVWEAVVTGGSAPGRSKFPGAATAKTKGRDAFLSDDFAAAWTSLSDAELLDPWDAEIPALLGRVELICARPLRTGPALLSAFAHARRSWDLDPKLAAGPVLTAEAGFELLQICDPPLASVVGPVTAAACEAADALGRADARMLAFAGDRRLASGDAANAVKLLRRAATKAPDSVAIHVSLARAEHAAGSVDRAKTALRRARELNGGAVPDAAADLAKSLGE